MFLCSNRHIIFYAQAAYIRAIDDSLALRRPLVGIPWLTWAPLGSPVIFWARLGYPGLPWALRGYPGLSWARLGSPGLSSGSSGLSWTLLCSSGLVWALLGSPGFIRASLGSYGFFHGQCGHTLIMIYEGRHLICVFDGRTDNYAPSTALHECEVSCTA